MKRLFLFSVIAMAMTMSVQVHARILPPNNLFLQDNIHSLTSNINEEQFKAIVNNIVEIWKPLAKAHGANLTATADWNDSTVNAYAQQSGNNWQVHFFGGLARRPEITPDGFALVVCHELGHHFGGYAFYGDDEWGAAEGESDYWATQVCARHIWAKAFRNNAKHFRFNRPSVVQDNCSAAWKTPEAVALCNRITDGGLALATLLNALGGSSRPPKIDTPDTSQVGQTNVEHPEAQCRLDTYVAGAVCTKGFDLSVIPGRNTKGGQSTKAAEAEAAKYSCFTSKGDPMGARPRCWFAPLISQFFRR